MKNRLILPILLVPFFAIAQVSSFSFNINGPVPLGFAEALTVAGNKWSQYLQITVPIKVNVFTVNSTIFPFSGITAANGRRNFSNAPVADVLYTSALANQIAGTEVNPGQYDMDIYFNLASSFHFGESLPPSSALDFISTAMHEIGHGLGFYSAGYVDNQGYGAFGNVPLSALFPLVPSFPWHGQDSVPTIYDKYMVRSSGNSLANAASFGSTALGDSIRNGPIYFNGPMYANASHFNTPVRLSGGNGSFSLGEDLLHIHDSYPETIMSYYWGRGDTVRTPAPHEIGILREIGWNLTTVGLKENNTAPTPIHIYPNPADKAIVVYAKNVGAAKLFSTSGKLAQSTTNSQNDFIYVDTQNLDNGIYFLQISIDKTAEIFTKKIIVSHIE